MEIRRRSFEMQCKENLTIISSLVGHMSFKKTGLPSFEVPVIDHKKSR